MPSTELFQLLFEYNAELNRYLWDSIMTLSDEQFTEEVNYSHGSVRNHIVHLAGVDGRWLRGLQGLPDAQSFRPKPEDYPTRAAARLLWDSVVAGWAAHIATLTAEQLNQTLRGLREPAWQILLHVVNHATDHRAQLLRQLYDLGAPTFDQDLILYLFQMGGK